MQLLHLDLSIAGDRRVADVGVDLALGGDADPIGSSCFARWTLLAGITIRPLAPTVGAARNTTRDVFPCLNASPVDYF
jgi:hypothetical protein